MVSATLIFGRRLTLRSSEIVVKAPPPKGFQVLRAPVEIPIKIPDIDLSKKVTDEADFSGKGVKGGVAKGVEGGVPQTIDANQTYYEFQVEKPVAQIPAVPFGTWEQLKPGKDVALLAVGTMVLPAVDAATRLAAEGVDAAVVKALGSGISFDTPAM